MLRRVFSLLLILAIGVIVAFNFKQILAFGRANQIEQTAKKSIAVGNWEKAIQLYEEGHRQYPANQNISLKLAWLYRQANEPAKAEELYRAILKEHPDNMGALTGLANLLKADPKRINEAITELRRALKVNSRDARLLAQIGDVYKTAAENPDESREKTRKWLYDQARYYYELSLKRNSKQFQTRFNLAVAYQNMGEEQNAAKAYCEAILLNPNSYEARYNLGLVLSELNYLDESYRQLDAAVKMLSEQDKMAMAQDLAVKVQRVKTRIYNSNRKGLSSPDEAPFLEKGCLVKPIAATGE